MTDPNEVVSAERANEIGYWLWVYPGMTAYTDNSKVYVNESKNEESKDVSAVWQSQILWKHSKNVTEMVNSNPRGDTDEGIAQKACDDLVKEYVPKMIGADGAEAVRALVDELNQKIEVVGFDKTLAHYQAIRDENRARMAG